MHHPDILHDYVILVEYCELLVSDDVTSSNHLQNTRDVSFSFRCGKHGSSTIDPINLSSYLSKNSEGEIYCFSYPPLYDSSDHKDTSVHDLELSNCGSYEFFIDSVGQDLDSSTVDFSKPPIFYDVSFDELELPQFFEEVQL